MTRTKKTATNHELPAGQFATALKNALDEKGMSTPQLAKKLNRAYEHIRKMVKGLGHFPGNKMLKDICHILDLDEDKMRELIAADKIQHQHGGTKAAELSRLIENITPKQYGEVKRMLQSFDRVNRAGSPS